MTGRYAVIGLGSFGISVARALSSLGVEVVAIDKSRDKIEDIKDYVASALILDATDEKALKAQDLEECEGIILSLGEDLGQIVLAMTALQKLGLKRIIVQVRHAGEKTVLERLGAAEVVIPPDDSGKRLAQKIIMEGAHDALPMGNGYWLTTLRVPEEFVGKTLIDLKVRKRYRINIVALFQEEADDSGIRKYGCKGEVLPEYVFRRDDFVGVFGREEDIRGMLD